MKIPKIVVILVHDVVMLIFTNIYILRTKTQSKHLDETAREGQS